MLVTATTTVVEESQYQRVSRLAAPWITKMGLSTWDISLELVPDGKLEEAGGPSPMHGTAADCVAEWEYERATIRFDEPYITSISDKSLEGHVIHELLHCVLDIAAIKVVKAEEYVVTRLTRAFQAAAEENHG